MERSPNGNGESSKKETTKGTRKYKRFSKMLYGLRSLLVNLPARGPEPLGLTNLLNMSWVAQGVFVATKLGIPEHLRSGAKTVKELAVLTQADEGRLQQLMRALAGFGAFALDEQGRYGLTLLSEPLADPESSLRLYILIWGEQLWAAGGKMLSMVQSGEDAFELASGKHVYEYYKANLEAGSLFVNYMNQVTEDQRNLIAKTFDFGSYGHVVDIGGGRASMLTAVLQTYPALRGTILDQPHMAGPISERIASANVADRCSFVGGSFLESVPPGGDLYMIKHVLHDWNDSDVAIILRNVAAAMPPNASLLVIEGLSDDRNNVGRFLKMRDLEQMIWSGGKVRTRREFERLLGDAGFHVRKTQKTSIWDGCLILAQKS